MKIPWNKGNRKYTVTCRVCGKTVGKSTPSIYCSKKCFDQSPEKKETCSKNGKSLKGKTKKEYHESWGYKYIFLPDHPKRDVHGYVAEHRLVVEKYLGINLTYNDVVHHKNGNKKDNRLENLEIMNRQKHAKIHLRNRDNMGRFI